MQIIEWIAAHDVVRDLLKDALLLFVGAALTIAGAGIQEWFARRRGAKDRENSLADAKRDSSETAARDVHRGLTKIFNAATAEARTLDQGAGITFDQDVYNETISQAQLIADETTRTVLVKALRASKGVGPAVEMDSLDGPPHRVQRKLLYAANEVLSAYIRREDVLPPKQIDFILTTWAVVDATWNDLIAGGEAEEV